VAPKGHFGDAGPVASRPIGILSLALLLLGGCSKDAPILRADIPLEPGDRSVLISLLRPNSIEARAYAVEDQQLDAPWMLGFEAEEELRLQVLGYSQSLAQLQLPAGPLNFAETGAPSRPLPAPTRVVERRLAEATLGEWTEVGAADAEVLTRRLPLRCTNFTVSEAILPNEVRAMFLVATRDHLLMGNADGEIYLAKSDGTFTRLATLGRFYDAFAQDDGTVYLGGESGQIWRATLSRTEPWVLTATLAVTLPDGGPVLFLAGDPAGAPGELYAATDQGLYSEVGGTWTRRYSQGRPRGLAWLGAGTPRGVYGYEFYLGGLRDGALVEDQVHFNTAAGGMTAVAHVPGLGGIGGVEYGTLYRRLRQGEWDPVGDLEPSIFQIRSIAPYGFGFVYARPDGVLEVLEEQGCEAYPTVRVVGDPDPAELGAKVEEGIDNGGRTELTVVGLNLAALGFRGGGTSPRLFWFLVE
jgi:hypothetical protein